MDKIDADLVNRRLIITRYTYMVVLLSQSSYLARSYIPSIERVLVFLYDVCSIVALADERVGQVDHLVKVTLIHG